MRRCQNQYRYCQNPAISDKGRSYGERLCLECLARRIERQRNTALQPTCHCGNKMALDAVQCRGCDWRDEQREEERRKFNQAVWRALKELQNE